ncbi:hypothetical protein FHY18_004438 [Xanthomonas arboricola]|uniref:hypothetical protein n=1 Tax=Xanthomonas sp. 3793 TaxID=3035312 RepID=UPI00216994D6|nr:hypothetical protein [Xanthomonas sp. 3793]MCS3748796.1 hypothetical protein [Xanthomonas sp. 3793]
MKRFYLGASAIFIFSVAGSSLAATCFNSDGFVVPCPGPNMVQAILQPGTLPKFVGVQADIYITGGNTVDYGSNFKIYANGEYLCNTSDEFYSATPVRHCKATIRTPGTYRISAIATSPGQNFNPPASVYVNVD